MIAKIKFTLVNGNYFIKTVDTQHKGATLLRFDIADENDNDIADLNCNGFTLEAYFDDDVKYNDKYMTNEEFNNMIIKAEIL